MGWRWSGARLACQAIDHATRPAPWPVGRRTRRNGPLQRALGRGAPATRWPRKGLGAGAVCVNPTRVGGALGEEARVTPLGGGGGRRLPAHDKRAHTVVEERGLDRGGGHALSAAQAAGQPEHLRIPPLAVGGPTGRRAPYIHRGCHGGVGTNGSATCNGRWLAQSSPPSAAHDDRGRRCERRRQLGLALRHPIPVVGGPLRCVAGGGRLPAGPGGGWGGAGVAPRRRSAPTLARPRR